MESDFGFNDERLPCPRVADAHDLVKHHDHIRERLLEEAYRELERETKKLNTDFIRFALSCRLRVEISHDHTAWLLRSLWRHGDERLRAALPPHARNCDAFKDYPL
jgi:hypothetical protein